FLGEFGGGEERCSVDAVASGFCAHVDDGIPDALGFGEEDVFLAGDAEGEGVHEWVLRIAGFESDFTADGRDAEAIAIVRDAADHAVEDAAIRCSLFRCFLLFFATRHSPLATSDFSEP